MRVCSVHTVPTPTQRAEGRGSTMYYAVPLFQPGGEERRPPSSSRSVGLSSGISFPSISHCHPPPPPISGLQCLSGPVGPCAVCRARCRSSSEVNVPVHDLQAVAVLWLRATVLAIFTRNTLAHPPLPRVHRAPIGPSAHRAHSDTTESKRDNRAQLLTQHRGMPHTRRLRPAKISNHHRASAPAGGTRSTPRRSRIAHYCPTSTHVHTPRLPLAYADRRPTRSIIGFKELNDSETRPRLSLVTGHWSLARPVLDSDPRAVRRQTQPDALPIILVDETRSCGTGGSRGGGGSRKY